MAYVGVANRTSGAPRNTTGRSERRKTAPGCAVLADERIRRIRRRLLSWGRANYISYAWRTEADPWLSLVAEFLLQRTRSTQVEPVYRELGQNYPTAASLVLGGTRAVRALTDRLGLHWRGPLLIEVAKQVARRGGQPPETLEELRKLPGVGVYTAAAWLSLHRGRRASIVDSNVSRLLSRVTGLPYHTDPRNVRWVNELAERLTARYCFRDYNYAILDFTMTICGVKNPECTMCPLRQDCVWGRHAMRRQNNQARAIHVDQGHHDQFVGCRRGFDRVARARVL